MELHYEPSPERSATQLEAVDTGAFELRLLSNGCSTHRERPSSARLRPDSGVRNATGTYLPIPCACDVDRVGVREHRLLNSISGADRLRTDLRPTACLTQHTGPL